ncbi:MAG: hemolysin family protein [Trueperella sp.]|nr:hemolysin family protein [Trueperella sp.]
MLLLLAGVLLTAGTAVFVSAEFSLVALDPATVDARANEGDPQAKKVVKALHSLSLQLSSCQVGITITTIVLGYVAQEPLYRIFANWFTSGMTKAAATTLAGAIAFIALNLFSMLFGELVPKNMALASPLRTAALISAPLRAFTKLFKLVIVSLNESANWILRRFGVEPAHELSGARSATELIALVHRSAQEGTLDVSTARLLTRSIDMGGLTAVEIMTDRGRVNALHEDDSAADVVELAKKTGHSRFPVIGEDLDDIRGFVHVRRAVAIPYEARSGVKVTSSSLMIPPTRVPETMELAPLLVQLRQEGMQMALVVDEYGGTAGVVTLEDAIEEIVGEVSDEHDPRRSRARSVGASEWMVAGTMRPDEVYRECGIDIPSAGPWETVGGWIMAQLGRIPAEGDEVHEADVWARVELMDGRRVQLARVGKVSEQ